MLDETEEDVDATDDNVERAEITKGRINTSAMGKLSVNKKNPQIVLQGDNSGPKQVFVDLKE